jgi:hypothetical protein
LVTIAYDRDIAVKEGYVPKIRLADENVKKEEVTVSANGAELVIRVHIEKIRDGDIRITLGDLEKGSVPEITDVSGEYAAKAQTVSAIIPSGVTLAQTAQGDGGVTAEVTHVFDIRGIAWILFTDGGAAVSGSLLNGADELDGAVAMHGHEFLSENEFDLAADLCDVLTNHFGDRYTFSVDGTSVTAVKNGDPGAVLAIEVYTYAEIE